MQHPTTGTATAARSCLHSDAGMSPTQLCLWGRGRHRASSACHNLREREHIISTARIPPNPQCCGGSSCTRCAPVPITPFCTAPVPLLTAWHAVSPANGSLQPGVQCHLQMGHHLTRSPGQPDPLHMTAWHPISQAWQASLPQAPWIASRQGGQIADGFSYLHNNLITPVMTPLTCSTPPPVPCCKVSTLLLPKGSPCDQPGSA